jgi:hypothetical protein
MTLDQALQEVVDILRRAYPSGVPQDDYLPMLVVLGDGLAEENLGIVVEEFTGIDRYLVIHEAVEAMTTKRPAAADIERVEHALSDAGWSSDD